MVRQTFLIFFVFAIILSPCAAQCPCAAGTCSQFTANFVMTSPSISNGAVSGTMIYDYANRVIAFNYTGQGFLEIYKFNANAGYTNISGQNVYRITKSGACQPCGSYSNKWAFPIIWSGCTSCLPNAVQGATTNGCTRFTVTNGASGLSWASTSYGLNLTSGRLCYIENQNRRFTVSNVVCGGSYNIATVTPPTTCKCIAPLDVVVSLDRSSSILTRDTYLYSQFVTSFLNNFYFSTTNPVQSSQMAITQWGSTRSIPTRYPGNQAFTMDSINLGLASKNIGCTGVNPCNFCDKKSNSTRCIDIGDPTQYTCTGCAMEGVRLAYQQSTYISRPNAIKIAVVITDGGANTLYPGGGDNGPRCCGSGAEAQIAPGTNGCSTDTSPNGCNWDVRNRKAVTVGSYPDLQIIAVGVGSAVGVSTLQAIATSNSLVYATANFAALLANLEAITSLACPEPSPQGLCGDLACGFCACGTPQLPEVPVTPNLCSNTEIRLVGTCYNSVNVTPPCVNTAPPCQVGRCEPTANNGAGGCIYTPLVCPQQSGCFNSTCFVTNGVGECSLGVCRSEIPGCCPTAAPTRAPTSLPTRAPTPQPTRMPTIAPTIAPTNAPTNAPTRSPTNAPTEEPTNAPTRAPTRTPTNAPTEEPTNAPTTAPTIRPTVAPTTAPTGAPTNAPTPAPSRAPTNAPTPFPSNSPTPPPTPSPTEQPTPQPTTQPTNAPTNAPTVEPTIAPTTAPTRAPTNAPTIEPTNAPTTAPTRAPTNAPTEEPTNAPTTAPTTAPTNAPTEEPTTSPTVAPTEAPTEAPTNIPCFEITQGIGCGVNGTCDLVSQTCICINNYTGILCNLPPGTRQCTLDIDCDDSNSCTTDVCDPVKFTCSRVPIVCNDNNACTEDACVPGTGCVFVDQASRCDDNNGCTIDSCNTVSGLCEYTNVSCDAFTTICLYAFCSPTSNISEQCKTGPVPCERPDNCTVVECVENETLTDFITGQDYNFSGCKNTTLNCDNSFFGIVAGLVGGAIAGITIAAAAVCIAGAAVAGGSYAISQSYRNEDESAVHQSPIYKAQTRTTDVML